MLRTGIVALVFAFASTAVAEERPAEERQTLRRDPFVISHDTCGASQYQHLVLRPLVVVQHASLLPSSANLVDHGRMTTLEYVPGKLNVVVDGQGRIVAISCF